MMVKIFFEAKGIQDWISSSGTLLDLSGGSELLEQLVSDAPEGYLRRACEAVGLCTSNIEMNAAGGFSLIAHEGDGTSAFDTFLELWPLVMRSVAPNLPYRLGTFQKTPNEATVRSFSGEAIQSHRLDGPLLHQSARTGMPAEGQDGKAPFDLLDEGSLVRRRAAREKQSLLVDKLLDEGSKKKDPKDWDFKILRDAASLVSEDGRRNLAYVHADASGLGAVFTGVRTALQDRTDLPALASSILKAFSDKLDAASQNAVRQALNFCASAYRQETWAPNSPGGEQMPVRPVLIGGDDMTFVLPSRYGHAFAGRYMQAFVSATRSFRQEIVNDLSSKDDLKEHSNLVSGLVATHIPERIEIGCGVAYVHMHYPAAAATSLAEDLCNWAKTAVKRTTSAMMFHRVISSAICSYDDVILNELYRPGQLTTAGPYLLEEAPVPQKSPKGVKDDATLKRYETYLRTLPTIEDLDRLTEALADNGLPRGPQKSIIDLTRNTPADAEAAFARLSELENDSGRAAFSAALNNLRRALDAFESRGTSARIWARRALEITAEGKLNLDTKETCHTTPLGDAHALLSVAHAPGVENSKFVRATE